MAQEVEVKIKVDTSQAVSGVNKLEQGLKGATKESTALGNTMQGSKQSEFINTLGDGVSKLNPAFGAAVKGANGLIVKMWEMAANPVGAVLAAIVVTAKFLYEAFQSSVAGGKELKAIFAGISAVGEQVKDAIFGLGRALINTTAAAYKFITLDFKGAAESMKEANREASNSYKQLGNAVDGTTAKIVYNLTKQQQANDKAKKLQAVTQSETNKLLVQSREILTDETASINEKKKALAEVTKAEKASSAEKTRIAAEDLRILKEKAKALGGEAEKKMKGEIREATIALNEAETENAMTGIKLNKQKKMLGRQEVADAKEKNDAIAASNKEVADKRKAQLKIEEDERKRVAKENLDSMMASAKEVMDKEKELREAQETPAQKEQREYEEWLAKYQENNLNTDLLEKEHQDFLTQQKLDADALKLETETKTEEDAKAKRDKQLQDEKDLEAQKLQVKLKALDDLQNIFGAESKIGKMALLAKQALMAKELIMEVSKTITFSAQAAARSTVALAEGTAQTAKVGFPQNIPLLIGYAAQAAGIYSAIKGALSSAKASGVSTPIASIGGGISTPQSAQPINVVGASQTNAIAQTMVQQGQTPIKAYVVANDITTQQSLDRNIVSSASIG